MKKTIKKYYVLLALLIMAIFIAGCSGDKVSKTAATDTVNAPADTVTAATDAASPGAPPAKGGLRVALGDEAIHNGVKITLLSVEMLDNVDVLLLLPEFYLKNNGNKPVTISPYANITSYIDGVEVTDGSVLDIAVLDKDLFSGYVEPGKELQGQITVRTHADWQTLEIVIKPFMLDGIHFTATRQDLDEQ
ncbi:MAG TPA: DUF4352 domain-containing protein [Fastidiosipila sp.]|nr:DUF4352 domain-containing protein [Fastidiosipila sp.]